MVDIEICNSCGMVKNLASLDEQLWDIYNRIRDGRASYEALVYTSDWLQENVQDDEDHDAVMHSMEKDMVHRGICPTCRRPDLRGVTKDMIMTHEEAKDIWDMWAEEASERRTGC